MVSKFFCVKCFLILNSVASQNIQMCDENKDFFKHLNYKKYIFYPYSRSYQGEWSPQVCD